MWMRYFNQLFTILLHNMPRDTFNQWTTNESASSIYYLLTASLFFLFLTFWFIVFFCAGFPAMNFSKTIFYSQLHLRPFKTPVWHKIPWELPRWWIQPCRLQGTPPPPGRNPQSCLYSSTCAESALGETHSDVLCRNAFVMKAHRSLDRARLANATFWALSVNPLNGPTTSQLFILMIFLTLFPDKGTRCLGRKPLTGDISERPVQLYWIFSLRRDYFSILENW